MKSNALLVARVTLMILVSRLLISLTPVSEVGDAFADAGITLTEISMTSASRNISFFFILFLTPLLWFSSYVCLPICVCWYSVNFCRNTPPHDDAGHFLYAGVLLSYRIYRFSLPQATLRIAPPMVYIISISRSVRSFRLSEDNAGLQELQIISVFLAAC